MTDIIDLQQSSIEILTCPYAYNKPSSTGKIKTRIDDFIVAEQLPFQPEGSGEHVFLQIEKCGENTDYVARLLARFSAVRQRDIGYAGLKDRHAKTLQWFSIWLPGKEQPDWRQVETDTIKIVQAHRHLRKLKRGVLSGNHFQIQIREWQGNKDKVEQQLQFIKEQGFPNYFGLQRFGHQGQNINKALALFAGEKVKPTQRSLYLSAARSYLFNQVLAKRVQAGNWNQAIAGDCLMFDQSNSYFKMAQWDESVSQRVKKGEIHPTAILFGKGELQTTAEAAAIEAVIRDQNLLLTRGLIDYKLESGRRALRVFAHNLQWEFLENSVLRLKFFLPSGCYATSLLREFLIFSARQ